MLYPLYACPGSHFSWIIYLQVMCPGHFRPIFLLGLRPPWSYLPLWVMLASLLISVLQKVSLWQWTPSCCLSHEGSISLSSLSLLRKNSFLAEQCFFTKIESTEHQVTEMEICVIYKTMIPPVSIQRDFWGLCSLTD